MREQLEETLREARDAPTPGRAGTGAIAEVARILRRRRSKARLGQRRTTLERLTSPLGRASP